MPLTLVMRCVSAPWSARQVRQLAYISEFTTDLRHVPGSRNVVVDALSRPSSTPPPPAQATVQKNTLKNVSPKSGSENFPDPVSHPRTDQAGVHKSTVKNNSPESKSVNFPGRDLIPSSAQATVQKSTLKNNSPGSTSVDFPDPQFLVAAMPSSMLVDYMQMAALQKTCA
jgi:hypothetical protein